MNNFFNIARARLALITLTIGAANFAQASDLALLEVLRNNKLITDSQFQALAEASKPVLPTELPAPQADQDVLDVLLANKKAYMMTAQGITWQGITWNISSI